MAYRLCIKVFGVLVAASVVLAPSAGADPGQLSGHYIRTATNRESGATMTTHWYATLCGPGCATVEICANDKHEPLRHRPSDAVAGALGHGGAGHAGVHRPIREPDGRHPWWGYRPLHLGSEHPGRRG